MSDTEVELPLKAPPDVDLAEKLSWFVYPSDVLARCLDLINHEEIHYVTPALYNLRDACNNLCCPDRELPCYLQLLDDVYVTDSDEQMIASRDAYARMYGEQAPSAWWCVPNTTGTPYTLETRTGLKFNVYLDSSATIEALKVQAFVARGITIDQQRIIHAGRQLNDERTLESYGIGEGANLYLILRLRGS